MQARKQKARISYIVLAILVVLTIAGGLVYRQIMQNKEVPAGTTEYSLVSGGLTRSYRVHIPESLPTGTDVPLVVVLHGALGTASQAEESYGWDEKAAEGKFIVAYPDGIKRSWKVSDGCCGPPASQEVDDTAFIEAMVTEVSKKYDVDSRRVYATGISNGGALAYRLACDTDIFAAIGAVSTNLLGECPSPKPISVVHIHGLSDETFPFAGGPGKRNNDGTGKRPANTEGKPIPEMLAQWRAIDACAEPVVDTKGAVTTSTALCADNRSVSLVTISGAGHQWPGSVTTRPAAEQLLQLDPPSTAINATDVIWDFFNRLSGS